MSKAKAKWQKEQELKVTANPEVSKENRKVGDIKDSAGHVAGQDTSRQSVKSTMWMRMMVAASGTGVALIEQVLLALRYDRRVTEFNTTTCGLQGK